MNRLHVVLFVERKVTCTLVQSLRLTLADRGRCRTGADTLHVCGTGLTFTELHSCGT